MRKIDEALGRCRQAKQALIEQVHNGKRQIEKTGTLISTFRGHLADLDAHLNKKIATQDVAAVCSYHQSGYTQPYELLTRTFETELKAFEASVGTLNHYHDVRLGEIQQHADWVQKSSLELKSKSAELSASIRLLNKYASPRYKFRQIIGALSSKRKKMNSPSA
jgi:hypothetical protein